MENEDEFEAYFQRAARAPVKQLSQQNSPISRPPTTTTTATRRASLQVSDVMYATTHAVATSKRSSPLMSGERSPSGDVYRSRTTTSPTSPRRHSGRRRMQPSHSADIDRSRESSSSVTVAAASKTTAWLAKHFEQSPTPSYSPRSSLSRRYRRSQLTSSPAGTVTTRRSECRRLPAGSKTSLQGRDAGTKTLR